MPTFSSTPRSSGARASGGSWSSAPRGGAPAAGGGTFSSTPRGSTRTPAATSALGIRNPSPALRGANAHPGMLPGPLNAVLTAASVPAFAVGQAILHPLDRKTWTASGRDIYSNPKMHTYPGQALRQRGALDAIPTRYGLRSTAAFIGDVALDPTTYLTFGAGAAPKAVARGLAEGAAQRTLASATAHAAETGTQVPLKAIAEAAAEEAMIRAAARKTIRVNLRVPLTRGKEIPVFETGGAHAVGRAVKRGVEKIPGAATTGEAADILGGILKTNRAIHPLPYAVYQATRRAANTLEHDNKRIANAIDQLVTKAAKGAGVNPAEANQAIAKWLDNPEQYPLPPALEEAGAVAAARRDAIYAEDVAAGIFKGEQPPPVETYFPHLADSAGGARALRAWRGQASTDKLYDPFFTQTRTAQNLDEFAAQGQRLAAETGHGFTPEYNVAKALEARGGSSIRARQLRAIDETLKDVAGRKPPPRSTEKARANLAAAKAAAEEARANLAEVMAPRSTDALQAEAAAARQEVTQAQAALDAARKTGAPLQVKAAERRLAIAERAAKVSVSAAVTHGVEDALPRFRELVARASATEARLPKPTAGRYVLSGDAASTPARLSRQAARFVDRAAEIRASVADELRALARERKATYRPASSKGYGAMRTGRHGAGSKGRHLSSGSTGAKGVGGADEGRYAFNAGNENSGVHYRSKADGGGRKTLTDYENDILRELDDQVAAHGVDSLTPAERRIYDAHAAAGDLQAQADEITNALRAREGGAFGELDPAAGRAQVERLAAGLPAQRVNMRARRDRAAGGPPEVRGNVAVSERGQAAMQRYFTPEGPSLREQAAVVRSEAESELQQAISRADRKVAKAKRDVERAQKAPSKLSVRNARKRLVVAQSQARNARLAVERARGTANGSPIQIVAAFKASLKADKRAGKAAKELGALERANRLLELRPGRPTSPEEWKALREGWTLVGEGTKTAKGVKLPTEVAAGIDEVHRLVAPLINDDAMHVAGRFIAGFTSRWKILALLSPGYHVRNQIDDAIRAFMAGARNPRSFAQAARILRGGIHEASATATIRIGRNVYTHREYLIRARAHGVIDAGWVRSEVLSSGQSEVRGQGWHGIHTIGRGRTAHGSAVFGNYRENVNRLGLFIELEKAGHPASVAARRTREFLIDYGEVGRFVDASRKFMFPFITYPSKVIPIYARELARHPGFFSHVAAAESALNQAAGSPDLSQLQFYNRSSFAVPLPEALQRGLGVPAGQAAIVNPNGLLGFGSLDMLDPHRKELVSNIGGSMLNPFVRVPIEIGTHRSLYFGSNMSRLATAPGIIEKAHELGVPIPTYVPRGGNPGGEKGKVDYRGRSVPGYSAYLNSILGTLPVYGQASRLTSSNGADARLNAAVRILLGIPISPYDATRQAGYAATKGR